MANSLFLHGQNKTYIYTLAEFKNLKPQDRRTGEEIAKDIIEKCGLIVKEN